jgi:hypothetical protein
MLHTNHINAQQLLQAWQQKKIIEKDNTVKIENFILSQKRILPLYLRILIGIGAFFSVNFFISFFYAARLITWDSSITQIVWGVVFIMFALFMSHVAKYKDTVAGHSFLIQVSFFAMFLGKVLFVMGSINLLKPAIGDYESAALSLLLITSITYLLYPISIDRFLSPLMTLVLLFITFVTQISYYNTLQVMLNLFFLTQLVLTLFLFINEDIKKKYVPLSYAIACSLAITTIFFSLQSKIDYGWRYQEAYNLGFIKFLMIISLLGILAYINGGYKNLYKGLCRIIALAIILLGIITQPGILLALCFITLGYARYEKPLSILGMILLAAFLFFYYYNLDVTLLEKASILIGSGMLLLAARGYMVFKRLDHGV